MSTFIDSIPCRSYGDLSDEIDSSLDIVDIEVTGDDSGHVLQLDIRGVHIILTPDQVKMLKEAIDTWNYGH